MSLKQLNTNQRQAVEAIGKPVLIFAGAGSGKTRVLTHKIVHLIRKEEYEPQHILAVTFTNKAADEMKERVKKLLRVKQLPVTIGTFHSLGARILRQDIHRLGYTREFAIYDTVDQEALYRLILNDLSIPKEEISPQRARREISLFKNTMITPEQAEHRAKRVIDRRLSEVYAAYNQALKDNNAADFDDLLLLPLEIFEKFPAVLKKYQKQWKYVLVDEYQDTNHPQFLLVQKLAESHQQICVVGDDDQSIYGWRGADIRNILNFENSFKNPEVYHLETNYRSTQEILDAASSVVVNNTQRQPKILKSHNGGGEKLGLIPTNDELEEADAVLSAIEKEIKLNKRSFHDFAVLYRTNAQSRALEDAFRRSGIPYNIVGGVRFYDRKEIKDVLGYLKIIVNLKDTISLRRVINFPPRGIGMKTVDKCVKKAAEDGKSLFEILNYPDRMDIRGKQAESLKNFHELILKYHHLLDKLSPTELVSALADETGIVKHYKDLDSNEDLERAENIQELLNSVDEFTHMNPDANLHNFLEEVSLLTDLDQWEDEKNRVTLMTLHSAKGLEFPVVFLCGLEDGLFPHYNVLDSPEGIEEERRLFYVGVTRSREKVYLLYATQRRRLGAEVNLGKVSKFVQEIPKDLLEPISFSSALTRKVVSTSIGSTRVKVTRSITDFDDFKVGDTVEHALFGKGTIKALSGTGENQRVGVVFQDGTKKKLIVKYANLKKL